jgi:hypothetical protein
MLRKIWTEFILFKTVDNGGLCERSNELENIGTPTVRRCLILWLRSRRLQCAAKESRKEHFFSSELINIPEKTTLIRVQATFIESLVAKICQPCSEVTSCGAMLNEGCLCSWQ